MNYLNKLIIEENITKLNLRILILKKFQEYLDENIKQEEENLEFFTRLNENKDPLNEEMEKMKDGKIL